MPLKVVSKEKTAGVFIVYPFGSIDTNTYGVLEEKIDHLILEENADVIILDMEGVDYISSMGIRVVVKSRKLLKKRDGSLVVMNLQPQIKKVFEIIKALPSLRIFSSIQELDDYLSDMQQKVIDGEDSVI
jgi:anti-anti-sigma factor